MFPFPVVYQRWRGWEWVLGRRPGPRRCADCCGGGRRNPRSAGSDSTSCRVRRCSRWSSGVRLPAVRRGAEGGRP